MLKPTRHASKAEWLKTCNAYYYVVYVTIIAVYAAIWYLNNSTIAETGEPYKMFDPNETAGMILQYGAIVYTLAAIPGALYWMKRSCAKIAKIEDEELKYDTYYTYALKRMGFVALTMYFGLAAYMLLGAYNPMLWLAAIGAIAFVFTKPTSGKAEEELRPQDENNPTY